MGLSNGHLGWYPSVRPVPSVKFLYDIVHKNRGQAKIFSVNSGELGGQRGIWKPKID